MYLQVSNLQFATNKIMLLLESGQRGFISGKTGSGKTSGALFHLRETEIYPKIIFDTKIDDNFYKAAHAGERIVTVENFEEFLKWAKTPRKDLPEILLVRPDVNEVNNVHALDKYSQLAYDAFGKCFVYFDELYNWHEQSRAGAGLIGLLTRGRSKGKTLLMGSQRPSWVSRFCITEAEKFFIYKLNDLRDRKVFDNIIENFSDLSPPPNYQFYFWESGSDDAPLLFKPVPMYEIETDLTGRHAWL